MKFILLIFILIAANSQAQTIGPAELAHFDLAKIKKTVDRSGGQYKPVMRPIKEMIRESWKPNETREIEVTDEFNARRRFVGFVIPSGEWLYGTPSGSGEVRYPNYNHRADDETLPSILPDGAPGGGAVLVPTCRNPQGTLTMDDPMNRREVSCFPSLMIFRKL